MPILHSDGDRYDGEWKTDERVSKCEFLWNFEMIRVVCMCWGVLAWPGHHDIWPRIRRFTREI